MKTDDELRQAKVTRKVASRLRRVQQCACSPANETFTPEERACWHMGRISQLVNLLAKLRTAIRHLGEQITSRDATIRNQRRTLSEMNQRAQLRNREIERLIALTTNTDVTPAPVFTSGDSNES